MTETPPKADPWIGRTIAGQFQIVDRIGAGGMGSVYLAEQLGMDRKVVVKVILANLSHDEDIVARFRREAKTIARLRHPNIVQVFTSGETPDGALYLAMEYVPGRTLGQELRRSGTIPDERIVHIAKQVAGALAAAHSAGVVHRDLKPANVILTEHPGNPDHAVVLDFGIAKVLEDSKGQTKLTQTGWMMGTPAYMSPEQIASRPVDGRTDIYTLGVMLYEMATGANPFDAETPIECMMKHLNEPVTPTRERFPNLSVSPALEACIQQCLEKDPADRFESAEALLERLRAIESRTAPVRYASHSQPPPRSAPRRSLVLAAVALALVAAGALAVSLTLGGEGERHDEEASATPVPEPAAVTTAVEPGAEFPSAPSDEQRAQPATSASPAPTAAETQATPAPVEAESVDQPKPPRLDPRAGAVGAGSRASPPAPVYRQPPIAATPLVAQPPAPEAQPEVEPALEPGGPFGAPLVAGARMETQLGSLVRYRSRFPFEVVAELYEDELRGTRVMMARHGEGLEEYLGIIDTHDELGWNMIRIQPEADGSTTLIFFSD